MQAGLSFLQPLVLVIYSVIWMFVGHGVMGLGSVPYHHHHCTIWEFLDCCSGYTSQFSQKICKTSEFRHSLLCREFQ